MTADSVAVDASSGESISLPLTLTSPVALANPVGGRDGQKLVFRLTQSGSGHHGVTWGDAYDFSGDLARPVLKATPGTTDLLGFIYDAAKAKWVYVAARGPLRKHDAR